MKKVLLTCEDYLPVLGGAEICVSNLAKELTRLEYDVVVYTNTLETTGLELEKKIVRVGWQFTPAIVTKNFTSLWKLCRNADIVHCQYSFRLGCLCAIICRLLGKPMLLTQQGRGIVPEAYTHWYHRPFYKLCQWISMKGAHLITSTSEEITDLTAQFVSRRKIIEVPNGFNQDLFVPNPSLAVPQEFSALPSDTKKIISVRRLVQKNGIHIFIQALYYLKKSYNNFHYFPIGIGRMQQSIEKLIEELDLHDHVTMLGSRTNEQLPNYYQHCDIVVVPSSAEATSIACIESLAMAKPVLASKVGGLIDLIGRENTYGTLVDIYGTEESIYDAPVALSEQQLQSLVTALEYMLKNTDEYKIKANNAAQHMAQRYSWQAAAQTYIELYKQLLPPSSSQ